MRKKLHRNEAFYSAQWMLRKLVPCELVDTLIVNVYIRKMKHQKGTCWAYQNNPNTFDIVISADLGRMATLRTIAHECVHVMQYATGKMKDLWGNNTGKVLWKNSIFEGTEENRRAYYKLPWEIEAFGMQEKLTRSYLDHVKKMGA